MEKSDLEKLKRNCTVVLLQVLLFSILRISLFVRRGFWRRNLPMFYFSAVTKKLQNYILPTGKLFARLSLDWYMLTLQTPSYVFHIWQSGQSSFKENLKIVVKREINPLRVNITHYNVLLPPCLQSRSLLQHVLDSCGLTLSHCVTVALQSCDTVSLWHCEIVALWY